MSDNDRASSVSADLTSEEIRAAAQLSAEDDAVYDAWLALLEQNASPESAPQGQVSTDVRRELNELLGLLGESTQPVESSSQAKGAMLATLFGDQGTGAAAVLRPSEWGASSEASWAKTEGRAADVAWWAPMAAAAGFVLALGFGGLSWWLGTELSAQSDRVANLEERIAAQETASQRLVLARGELDDLRTRYELVTSDSVAVCPLETHDPAQPDARGKLYLDRSANRWVLTASNLLPCELGRVYELWFVLDDGGQVSGGSFVPEDDHRRVELAADGMPSGILEVRITLESPDGVTRPEGPTVLYGRNLQQTL